MAANAATTACVWLGRWGNKTGAGADLLMGDAASCAKSAQKVPDGYYNIELMLGSVTRRGGQVGVCGTCMDARGITDAELAAGCHRSTLDELADWTQAADRHLVF